MRKLLIFFIAYTLFENTYCQTGSNIADSLYFQYDTIVSQNKNVRELIQITLRTGKGDNSKLNDIYFLMVKKDTIQLDYFYLSGNNLSKRRSRVLKFSEAQYINKVMADFKCFYTAGKCWHEKYEPFFHIRKGQKPYMKYVDFSKNEWSIKSKDKSRKYNAPDNPYKIGGKTGLLQFKCKSLFNNIKSRIRFRKIKQILEKE